MLFGIRNTAVCALKGTDMQDDPGFCDLMEQFLRIGIITSPHGLSGEVKVYPTTDSLNRFKEVKRVILRTAGKEIETEITGARFFKNMAIIKFEAFDNVDQVNRLQGTDIMIRREDGQKLEEGEYYIADLIGCRVVSEEDGSLVGTLKDVLQTGANDVYLVQAAEGVKAATKSGEILLPVIPQCIKKVDIENMVITAYLMPGLI